MPSRTAVEQSAEQVAAERSGSPSATSGSGAGRADMERKGWGYPDPDFDETVCTRRMTSESVVDAADPGAPLRGDRKSSSTSGAGADED